MINITLSKPFTFKGVPNKGISWKKRKDKIWIGSIVIHNNINDVWPLTEDQKKELIKLMKNEKTDVLTDGKYFYTTVNSGLVRIEHPELKISDNVHTKL